MSIDLDELKAAAGTSLAALTARREALESSLIGTSLDNRPPIQQAIDEMALQEFVVRAVQRDIAASENSIDGIDPVVQARLDALSDSLDAAIVQNARISAALDSATAFAQAVKNIQAG